MCTTITSHQKLVFQEKGRVLNVLNPERKKLLWAEIDGCLIPKGHIACDFGVGVAPLCSYLIELKGSNISHALVQLSSSLQCLRQKNLLNIDMQPAAIIVASKNNVPKLNVSPKYRMAKKIFVAGIIIKTCQYTLKL